MLQEERKYTMKINIYYGGRGMIDDPAIAVIGRITSVLDELRVNVERYDLHELKSGITALPQTIMMLMQ